MSDLERIGRDYGSYFTAAELADTVFPEPRWAVHGLIPEGLTLLAGAPKLGKSWLALGLGISIASGTKALGKVDAEPGDVLYAALEDTPRRIKSRLKMLIPEGPAPKRLSILMMLPEMPKAIDLLAGWLDEHPDARLVVVDVLGKVRPPQGGSSDRYENDYKVISALKQLADNYSVAVVVVTHTRKMADGDVFNTVSGSTGLTGAADTTMVLNRGRGEEDAALHITGRDVSESEYAVTFSPDTGAWTLDGDALADAARKAAEGRATAGLMDRSADVVAYVSSAPDGVRAKEVAEALELPEARRYLTRLEKSERIKRVSPGLYKGVSHLSHLSHVPEDDSPHGTPGTHGTPSIEALVSTSNRYGPPPAGEPCPACGDPLSGPGLMARCKQSHEVAA